MQAQEQAGSCEGLRNLLVLNGKYMAAASTKACRNSEYLMSVFTGFCWVPDYKHVKKANCLFPPKKQLILDAIKAEADKLDNP